MTATVTALPRRGHRRAQHPALADALERRMLRLSALLAARTVTLREATAELYDIHLRERTLAAQRAMIGQPQPVADAYVVREVAAATLEVSLDEQRSAIDIARAERPLGTVLVLPCGSTEGARIPRRREALDERSLW